MELPGGERVNRVQALPAGGAGEGVPEATILEAPAEVEAAPLAQVQVGGAQQAVQQARAALGKVAAVFPLQNPPV